MLIGAGIYGLKVYKSFNSAIDSMHQTTDRKKSDKRVEDVTLSKKNHSRFYYLGLTNVRETKDARIQLLL